MHRSTLSSLVFPFFLLAGVALVANAEEKLIGKFTNYHHGIAGDVYAVDEQTLKIKGFEYDGAGPDAFFWAGTQGSKPGSVGIILPHPFDGTFFDYEDRSAPILEGRFDKTDLTLTLPPGTQVSDLKWLSVWCRAFQVNFGDLVADFTLDHDHEGSDAEAESESEPETTDAEPESDDIDAHHPPLVSPDSNNAHDPHHRHHHHGHGHDEDEDADAEAEGYAEGEAESEAEAEAEAAYATGSENRPVALAVALSAVIALALW